jgi:hypothetical protein
LQKIEFLSLEQGQSETISGRRDVARAAARRRPPLDVRAPRATSRGCPSPGHAPTEAASESCPLLTPRADRPADTERTAGSFHAPCRSLLPRPALAPRSVAVRPSVAGKHAGRHKGVTAPRASRQAAPPRSTRARHRSRRGEVPPPAGCTPNQGRLHPSLPLL